MSEEDFIWAVKNGDDEVVKKFIDEKKFGVNQDIKGRRPIHYAADYGQADVIQQLLLKGADINIPDKHGISPLLSAIYESHEDCVKLLLAKGADKSGRAPSGETYFEAAETDAIKLLLK